MDSETLTINEKQVFICEKHHHVLKFWYQFRGRKPYLLTFDHHTDAHSAFKGYLYRKRNVISSQDCYNKKLEELILELRKGNESTIMKLEHDEHIDAAIKAKIIDKALIYSDSSYYSRPERVYTINGNEGYNGVSIIINPNSEPYKYNLAIETKHLKEGFKLFDLCIPQNEWEQNYILDIDLDYFKTCNSILPDDNSFFKNLIRNSIGISIAKESTFVKQWKEENDNNLSVDFLLENLLKLIDES